MYRVQVVDDPNWQTPDGCVYVGRGSRWENPFGIVELEDGVKGVEIDEFVVPLIPGMVEDEEALVSRLYRDHIQIMLTTDRQWLDPLKDAKALSCWCSLEEQCHADLLIEAVTS